jgi:hypothetical protein
MLDQHWVSELDRLLAIPWGPKLAPSSPLSITNGNSLGQDLTSPSIAAPRRSASDHGLRAIPAAIAMTTASSLPRRTTA